MQPRDIAAATMGLNDHDAIMPTGPRFQAAPPPAQRLSPPYRFDPSSFDLDTDPANEQLGFSALPVNRPIAIEPGTLSRKSTPRELRWAQQLIRVNEPRYGPALRLAVTEHAASKGVESPFRYVDTTPAVKSNAEGQKLKRGGKFIPSFNAIRYKIRGIDKDERNTFEHMPLEGYKRP